MFIDQQGPIENTVICGIQQTSLDVTGSTVTGEGFHVLQDKFINMEKLSLAGCKHLTNHGLLGILKICGGKLQNLNISDTKITGQGLEEMQGKLAELKVLNLSWCPSLADQGLLKVLMMCGTKLQDLVISNTNITGQGLEELQGKFADLKTMSLQWCSSLTDQGFSKISNISGPLLKTVKVLGSSISNEAKTRIKLNRPNLTFVEDEYEYEYA